jgi:uncharacterized protein YjbJ (UPF0337 family)
MNWEQIEGKRHFLAGKIQEVYGLTKEATEEQLNEWQARQKEVETAKADAPK